MSQKRLIVAVTGSTGAGLSTVRHAFKTIFPGGLRSMPPLFTVTAFRRYTEAEFAAQFAAARASGRNFSSFGPECNHFAELETFFKTYSETGSGMLREYAHNAERAGELGVPVGEFTAWQPLAAGSDLLFYEGQHGGVVSQTWTRRKVDARHFPAGFDRRISARGIDVAQYVDLLIGVVPAINLEWIQKIHRDCARRKCTPEEAVDTILRRMDDYIHYIGAAVRPDRHQHPAYSAGGYLQPVYRTRCADGERMCICCAFSRSRTARFIDLLHRIPGRANDARDDHADSRRRALPCPGGHLRTDTGGAS